MKPIVTSLHTIIFLGVNFYVFTTVSAKPLTPDKVRISSRGIDQLVASYLKEKKVAANPIIDDATFLRRSYISINGRIPTSAEARKFLTDPAKGKRETLVDTLIESRGYKSQMFNFWADLLRLNTNQEKFGLGWHNWILKSVENNKPYNKFVNEMLSAEGLPSKNPAVGYYLRDRNMLLDNVSNSAQIFLGTQIGCAQCHDHPFDDLTQKQYYEFAAFIGDTSYKSAAAEHMLNRMTEHSMGKTGAKPRSLAKSFSKKEAKKLKSDYASTFRYFKRNSTSTDSGKTLRLPKDYKYNDGKPGDLVTPQTIFGEPIKLTSTQDKQQAFADWITSSKNPRFTKVIVNRLWAKVFGRGIVRSLDDWSETTRISHPELLDYLCEIMKSSNYNVEQFLRVLYHTRLFQTAVTVDEAKSSGSYDFHGPLLRRMSAEQIYDSLTVLQEGNVDDLQNHDIKDKWKNYVKNVETFFKMSVPELIKLDKTVDNREKEIYAQRSTVRKLKLEIAKAEGTGDTKKLKTLKKNLSSQYAKNKQFIYKNGDDTITMLTVQQLKAKGSKAALRSSQKPAPAKPGTFIRQFGSSDRAITNASHTQASIPQALSLLNGKTIDALTYKKTALARGLVQNKSSSTRLEHLYLSIYSQMPSEAERQRYEPMMQSSKTIKTLIKAMLNSKRFLFVQ